MDNTKAMTDASARLVLAAVVAGIEIIVSPIIPRAAPADMLLILSEIESRNETLLTRPVLSLRNTTGVLEVGCPIKFNTPQRFPNISIFWASSSKVLSASVCSSHLARR